MTAKQFAPFIPASMLKELDRFFIGHDDTVSRWAQLHEDMSKNIPNYPPYNIKKLDDDKYVIEMAVVGFGKSDVEIEMTDNKLVVRGNIRNDDRDTPDAFLFKGIADRPFTRMFALGDHVEVCNAGLINGMLRVTLERLVPDKLKSKKIKIDTPSDDNPQMLVED